MIKYLLIILIFKVFLFKYASGQIITITQRGIRVISVKVPDMLPVNTLPFKKFTIEEDSNMNQIQSRIDLINKTVKRTFRNVSAPLNSALFVTSDFGDRFHPILQSETLHAGIDLRANYEVVNSIANGIIVKEGYDARSGNYLVIQHGNGIESIYCHLSKFLCRPRDLVFAGDRIAVSGATGAATAPHLHFAIKENGKFIDPLPLLKAIVGYK